MQYKKSFQFGLFLFSGLFLSGVNISAQVQSNVSSGDPIGNRERSSSTNGSTRSSSSTSPTTYGMPSVQQSFQNLQNTVNEIFEERRRAREERQQEEEDRDQRRLDREDREREREENRSSYSSGTSTYDDKAANDRALTERLEKQIEVEKKSDAIEAEMAKEDKANNIEIEMRREEFSPMVNEILTSNSTQSNDSSATTDSEASITTEEYNQLSPPSVLKDSFEVLRDKSSAFSAFAESSKEELPEQLAVKGLESVKEEVQLFDSKEEKESNSFGGILKDKVSEFIWDKVFEKSYDSLKEQIAEKLTSDPNNEYDKNVTETAVEIHPLTGFLPRLIKAGFNAPKALYEQGKAYIEKGMKSYGLAIDSTIDGQ